MNANSRGFVDTLIRVVVVQIVVAVAIASAVVIALGRAESSATRTSAAQTGLWQAAYSKQFPGCVASVLWPADEAPGSYLVQTRSGSMIRVSAVAMTAGQTSAIRQPGRAVIGVCR